MPVKIIVKIIAKLNSAKLGWFEVISLWYINLKVKKVLKIIKPWIIGKKILDVGVGLGGFYKALMDKGYEVTGVDVSDLSVLKGINPIIYDGKNLPFDNDSFDTSLLIHVLHHCDDGIRVLEETKRVSKRVIIVEDTYRNALEKYIVSFNDMLGNFEFFEYPYKKTMAWKNLIEKKGWSILEIEEFSSLTYGYAYGRYVLIVIE